MSPRTGAKRPAAVFPTLPPPPGVAYKKPSGPIQYVTASGGGPDEHHLAGALDGHRAARRAERAARVARRQGRTPPAPSAASSSRSVGASGSARGIPSADRLLVAHPLDRP